MYSTKTVKELTAILKHRGLKTRGRKAELVERLEAEDRMAAHPRDPDPIVPDPSPIQDVPPVSEFITLTVGNFNELPKVTRSSIESYIVYRQAHDRQTIGDNAAMLRGMKMLDQNVLAMSFSKSNSK